MRAIEQPDDAAGGEREQTADEGGRGGDGAIDGGPFHERPDDPQVFFRPGSLVHEQAL